ncbi:MAG: DUF5809 family protein [Halobacteriaceae archaeon]
METRGYSTPTTTAEARDRYETLGPIAQQVVRETARAMGFDATEYEDRVTSDVVAAARDAMFAAMLTVHVGDRAAFEDWQANNPEYTVDQTGNENVDRVAWHPAPIASTVVATTFQQEPDAAVAALRRQAWGRIYRDRIQDPNDS